MTSDGRTSTSARPEGSPDIVLWSRKSGVGVLHVGVPNFWAYLPDDAYERKEREKANSMDEYVVEGNSESRIGPIFFGYCSLSASTPIPDLGKVMTIQVNL